jgi:hypothetical protein
MWEKYCNLNAVETKTRSFHILTDGCGSSVLTDSGKPSYSPTRTSRNPKLLNGKKKVGYSTDRASLMSRPSHTSRWMVRISLRKHHPTALTVL